MLPTDDGGKRQRGGYPDGRLGLPNPDPIVIRATDQTSAVFLRKLLRLKTSGDRRGRGFFQLHNFDPPLNLPAMPKPERVSDYRDATQSHRGPGYHGIEKPTGKWIEQPRRQWHANSIVDESEK